MLYVEFINKAINETIIQADNSLFYLEPLWKNILQDNNIFFNDISDYDVTPEEIKEVLELEVKKRNTISSVKPQVLEWVHDLITATVEPAITAEETDYLKNLTEYLRVSKNIQKEEEQDKEWENFKKQ